MHPSGQERERERECSQTLKINNRSVPNESAVCARLPMIRSEFTANRAALELNKQTERKLQNEQTEASILLKIITGYSRITEKGSVDLSLNIGQLGVRDKEAPTNDSGRQVWRS